MEMDDITTSTTEILNTVYDYSYLQSKYTVMINDTGYIIIPFGNDDYSTCWLAYCTICRTLQLLNADATVSLRVMDNWNEYCDEPSSVQAVYRDVDRCRISSLL